jgi:hypothetical protein
VGIAAALFSTFFFFFRLFCLTVELLGPSESTSHIKNNTETPALVLTIKFLWLPGFLLAI